MDNQSSSQINQNMKRNKKSRHAKKGTRAQKVQFRIPNQKEIQHAGNEKCSESEEEVPITMNRNVLATSDKSTPSDSQYNETVYNLSSKLQPDNSQLPVSEKITINLSRPRTRLHQKILEEQQKTCKLRSAYNLGQSVIRIAKARISKSRRGKDFKKELLAKVNVPENPIYGRNRHCAGTCIANRVRHFILVTTPWHTTADYALNFMNNELCPYSICDVEAVANLHMSIQRSDGKTRMVPLAYSKRQKLSLLDEQDDTFSNEENEENHSSSNSN